MAVDSPTRAETLPSHEGWHALDPSGVLERVGSSRDGLTSEEAERRIAEHGPNRLPEAARRGILVRFLAQFNNLFIYVLIVAGVVTALLGHWIDAGVIFGVVVINAIVGFIQEGKAERALDAIRDMLSLQAVVIRDGRRFTIPAESLVPGDVVFLQSGDRVPADLRLLRTKGLLAQEAALTGESVPVEKTAEPVAADAPLAERTSMTFSGTLVSYGQGTGVVVATGAVTEIGRISALIETVQKVETPLLRQLAGFARWLTAAILLLAAASFAFGIAIHDFSVDEMFLAAVGIAVAAIPEGLPAIMTITLAIGVQHMARRNAIVRRLPAVETLGSVSVICSDKTGTLTRNEMTAQSIATAGGLVTVTGVGYAPLGEFRLDGTVIDPETDTLLPELLRGAMLCSDATLGRKDDEWVVEGDPTEGALVVAATKAGLDAAFETKALPRTDLIPFESEHRFMATLHHDHEGRGCIYVKGAPERVLGMCARQRAADGDAPLDREYWEGRMAEIADRGERLLALAFREAGADHRELRFGDVEGDLVLMGLFGLADPPRDEAIEAVRLCRQAGIRAKMITGDHAGTARAIARQIGFENPDKVLTGADLDRLSTDELADQAVSVDVFARTSPEHKLKLVTALQARGRITAMTGDGVNDAPALHRADVGVAMGLKGTEAAKEAAEMVLADDNFATIAGAVEQGRTIYDNLLKAIIFILPTNGGQAFTIVAAIMLGLVLPLTAAQVLWVNMVTAVTLALALAFEPSERDVMHRPPRPSDQPLLSGFLVWRVAFVSALLLAATFGMFVWMRSQGADIETARTTAVNTLVMCEIFYLFNTRHLMQSCLTVEGVTGSRPVLVAIGLVLILQLLFTYAPPMQALFRTAPLDAEIWGLMTAAGLAVFLLVEAEKAVLRRVRRDGTAVR